MINLTLADAAKQCGGFLYNANPDVRFCGVETDSRKIKEGMLFAPIVGARADGHTFKDAVLKQGAAGMFWQSDHAKRPKDIPLIVVDDVIKAMGLLAHFWLESVDPYTIGITGSNGKTSAKDFTASLFSTRLKCWKTQGNRNSEIGLPLTIFEMDADTEALILEMGMENKGEIAQLCKIAPLDTAIITSIGSAHLENLGSKENIARAKCEILSSLKDFGTFIYNNDSDEIRTALREEHMNPSWTIIPYGKDTDFEPQNVHLRKDGLRFFLPHLCDETFQVPSASYVQADNATAALLAAKTYGIAQKSWKRAIEETPLTAMRGQILRMEEAVIVDDTYKSNPEAAAASLRSLMELPADEHIAVLGDMLDLGEDENELHAGIGRLAKELGVSRLYTYGPRSLHTQQAFGPAGGHYESKEALIEALRPFKHKDAAILIKGSRSMAMDDVVRGCLKGEAMKKIRLGIIFGGQSSEYSVSLHSAASFIRALDLNRYEPVLIGISKSGEYYRCLGGADVVEHDNWMAESRKIAWVRHGIYDFKLGEPLLLDCVFPILHGKNGEDGAVQGLCAMFDLPCAGCDILGSAICMDKEVMHRLCELAGIPCADYVCLNSRDPLPSAEEIEKKIPLPWVIKPCNAGSSYGVAYVDSLEAYPAAVANAFAYDGRGKILVEQAIDGFEIGCAVMGDQELETGEIDEIETAAKVFDFDGKYAMKDSTIYCPARLSKAKSDEAKALAKKVFRVLCCTDMARVDMFIEKSGRILLNEVNTIPGFTDTSRYPSMMAAAGRPFSRLIDELVDLAMEKERHV